MSRPYLLGLSFFSLAGLIIGQTQAPTRQYQVDRATLTLFAVPNFYMNVWFTDTLGDGNTLDSSNIHLTTTPVHTLNIGSASRLPGTRKAIQVNFTGTPPTDVTDAKVCFDTLSFLDAQKKRHEASKVCFSLETETTSTIASQKQQALDELNKVPKTASEKNIFASGRHRSDDSEGLTDQGSTDYISSYIFRNW